MRWTKAAKEKAIIFDQQGAHKGSRWQHSGFDEEAGDMILAEEIGAKPHDSASKEQTELLLRNPAIPAVT